MRPKYSRTASSSNRNCGNDCIFSGTGNSRFVAQELARETGDKATDMVRPSGDTTEGRTDVLGIVYPVHAWGIPATVQEYLKSDRFPGKRFAYIYAVCTCGDDVGKTYSSCGIYSNGKAADYKACGPSKCPIRTCPFPFSTLTAGR